MKPYALIWPLLGAVLSCPQTIRLAIPGERDARTIKVESSPASASPSASLEPPTLGFLVPTGRDLRTILGIPGAVHLSDPVRLPGTVTRVHIAPGHRYALVEQGPEEPMGVLSLDATIPSGSFTLNAIPSAFARPDSVTFGPAGSSAVLYSAEWQELEILYPLPQAQVRWRGYSGTLLASPPRVLAISDDAQRLLLADQAGTVYLMTADSVPVPVYQSADISALAFVPNSHDAVLCDRARNAVVLAHEVGGSPRMQVIATSANGIEYPQSVTVTGDGSAAIVGDGSQQRVWTVSLTSGVVVGYDALFAPTLFERSRDSNTFLVYSSPGKLKCFLLTWDGEHMAITFVPSPLPTHPTPRRPVWVQ